nr:hypothetical protein [Tanacetum cinerariifolium]
MVNIILPHHVDDVPVGELDQHDDVLVIPEPILVDEDEDPEEDEFKEEEDPQEEEDDMEVDIEEDENDPELTDPYEEMDPLNPPPPASESETEHAIKVNANALNRSIGFDSPVRETEHAIKVENSIEHEDKTIPASVHEVGESSTAPLLREDSDGLFPGLMERGINYLFGRMASLLRRLCGCETAHALVEKKGKVKDEFYGKLILDLGNKVYSSMEQGMAAIEKLVEKLGNAEDKVECKKLKKELEEARFSNTFLCMQNKRVKRDLYWTRVRAHEFYHEMIRKGFMFKERPNEAINSAPLTQAAIRQMINDNIDAAIAAERARQANVRNEASRSGPVRHQDAVPTTRECTFAGFMKCNHTAFCGTEGAVEL